MATFIINVPCALTTTTTTTIPVYAVTVYFRNLSAPSPESANVEYSTTSNTGPWTAVFSPTNSTSCDFRGTVGSITSGTTVYFRVVNNNVTPAAIEFGIDSTTCPTTSLTLCSTSVVVTSDINRYFTANVSAGEYFLC